MSTTVPPPDLPRDDVGATLARLEGLRGRRYGEVILIGTDATGHRIGSVYDTMGADDGDA